jgi:hypothetical protein
MEIEVMIKAVSNYAIKVNKADVTKIPRSGHRHSNEDLKS